MINKAERRIFISTLYIGSEETELVIQFDIIIYSYLTFL